MPSRPNILVFLTDDHGQWASGCYGAREILSPALDALAVRGARCTNACTTSPVCSPARASFFTGLYPSQHGIHDYLGAGFNHPGLTGQTTLGERMQAAGYRTALVGKWHCGGDERPPGFDSWLTYRKALGEAHHGEFAFATPHGEVIREGHLPHIVTSEVLRFLDERAGAQPFFMTVAYSATHGPFKNQPDEQVARYAACKFDDIPHDARPEAYPHTVWPPPEGEVRRAMLAQYYAAVSTIDGEVARILGALETRGELSNTLVVYTSDHGHMNGHHNLWLKGNSTTPQNLLDESIMVPCLLAWPGVIAPGRVIDEPVNHCDLHATLLAAAGIVMPQSDDMAGRSYLPLLTGGELSEPWRAAQFCEYGNARMIRTASAKLIRRYAVPGQEFPDEYYDLAADPREVQNRIADPAAADTVAALSARLEEFFGKHETPGRAGRDIWEQPRCNNDEPWRRPAVTVAPAPPRRH